MDQRLEEELGRDINSTGNIIFNLHIVFLIFIKLYIEYLFLSGSILSELSVTQSDDDLLNRSCKYKKHRPSNTHNHSGMFLAGERRSKLSTDRRSGNINKRILIEIVI